MLLQEDKADRLRVVAQVGWNQGSRVIDITDQADRRSCRSIWFTQRLFRRWHRHDPLPRRPLYCQSCNGFRSPSHPWGCSPYQLRRVQHHPTSRALRQTFIHKCAGDDICLLTNTTPLHTRQKQARSRNRETLEQNIRPLHHGGHDNLVPLTRVLER